MYVSIVEKGLYCKVFDVFFTKYVAVLNLFFVFIHEEEYKIPQILWDLLSSLLSMNSLIVARQLWL